MASIDLADPADRLLVVLPISSSMFGPAAVLVERQIRRELNRWRAVNPGSQTIVVRPEPAIAALARRPHHLFDVTRARRCYELAYASGIDVRRRWSAHLAD
jgi:hypothetical protein